MQTVGRLTSTGVMQVYGLDELSGGNARFSGSGVLYSSLFDENLSLELNTNKRLRIKNDKSVVVYNYFDEYSFNLQSQAIFGTIKSLTQSLSSFQNVTSTNFQNVQTQIQSSNPAFNVFAVVTRNKNSQSLQGIGSGGGKYNFTQPNFVYNTSNSNILSTGNEIVSMTGGADYGLPAIDGNKWMAMSVFDGNTNGFLGTILWIFTNNTIDSLNNVTSNGKPVTTTQSIFYPTLPDLTYMKIYQVILDYQGNVVVSNTSTNAGWNYSSNQQATSSGYYSTSQFSYDDGLWAQIINGKTAGNSGPDYRTANGYGFGNYNGTDATARLYWGGVDSLTTNYVGFVYTGDA